ncbi:MAG: hypothetical protein HZC28_01850 [Spirochaetes bacterium]|nr:hypothetical protein [Spirochaetota bacterium]
MNKNLLTCIVAGVLVAGSVGCIRMDVTRPREIMSVTLYKDISVFSNETLDLAAPRIYVDAGQYVLGNFYYIDKRGSYIIDAKTGAVLHVKGDRIDRVYSNETFRNATIQDVDDKGNVYLSYTTLRNITNTVTNITATQAAPAVPAPSTNDSDPTAEVEASNAIATMLKPVIRERVYTYVETRYTTSLERFPLTGRKKTQSLKYNYDFNAIERAFSRKSGELVVITRVTNLTVLQFMTNGELSTNRQFPELETMITNEENGTSIDSVMLVNNDMLALLVTAYAKGRPEKKVYTYDLASDRLTEQYKSPVLVRDIPVGITDHGILITMNYQKPDHYTITRNNIFGKDSERKVLVIDKKHPLQHLSIYGDALYALSIENDVLRFFEIR